MKNSASKDSIKDDLAGKQNDQKIVSEERAPLSNLTKARPTSRKRRRPAAFDTAEGTENSVNAANEVSMMTMESGPARSKPRPGPPPAAVVTTQNLTPTLRKFSLLSCALPVIAAFVALDSVGPESEPAPEEPLQPTLQFDLLSQSPSWSTVLVAGIERHARQWELQYRVHPDYLAHAPRGFTATHRATMVNAMLNFTRGRNWTQLTVHLAVNLLDRYLSAILKAPPATDAASPPTAARTTRSGVVPVAAVKKSPAPKPTGPRLSDPAHRVVLTATMLWMAYKLEEKQTGFNFAWLRDLARDLAGPVPGKEAVVRCEGLVVAALDYHLTAPTAQVYLTMLAAVADMDVETFSLSKCLAERCLLDYSLLRFLPSELACAAVYLARVMQLSETAGPERPAVWTAQLQSFSGRTPADVRLCVEAVQAILRRETNARARLHGHAIMAGTDYSYATLLRTLQHLAGNNARGGGWILQPFSPAFPSGRISERLQAYHDVLPGIFMGLQDNLLKEVKPYPRQDAPGAAAKTSLSVTTATPAPPTVSQASSSTASGEFQFRIFGTDILSSVAAAPRTAPQEAFMPLSQLSQLTAEESLPFSVAAFEPLRLGSIPESANSFAALSRQSASDSFPWLPEGLQALSQQQGLSSLTYSSAFPPLTQPGSAGPSTGFAPLATVTATTRTASSASVVSGATTAPASSQTSAMTALRTTCTDADTAPRPFASLRRTDSTASDAFPVVSQDVTSAGSAGSGNTVLTPRSGAPVVSQPPPLPSAAAVPKEPVLCFSLAAELQHKYELYPTSSGEALLTLALRSVADIEPVFDSVLLRYRQHYRRLVACPPSF